MDIIKLLKKIPEHKRDEIKNDILEANINQAKEVLLKAEIANKGRHVHNINANMHRLEYLLKQDNIRDITSEQFSEMCRIKQGLAALLFYAQNSL